MTHPAAILAAATVTIALVVALVRLGGDYLGARSRRKQAGDGRGPVDD
jgi:hypothetical protein